MASAWAPVPAAAAVDEPTGGLHPAEIDRLMLHLHKLADAGNTVVVVELDMEQQGRRQELG